MGIANFKCVISNSFLKIQSSYFAEVCDKLLINSMQDISQISEIPSELNNLFSFYFKKSKYI